MRSKRVRKFHTNRIRSVLNLVCRLNNNPTIDKAAIMLSLEDSLDKLLKTHFKDPHLKPTAASSISSVPSTRPGSKISLDSQPNLKKSVCFRETPHELHLSQSTDHQSDGDKILLKPAAKGILKPSKYRRYACDEVQTAERRNAQSSTQNSLPNSQRLEENEDCLTKFCVNERPIHLFVFPETDSPNRNKLPKLVVTGIENVSSDPSERRPLDIPHSDQIDCRERSPGRADGKTSLASHFASSLDMRKVQSEPLAKPDSLSHLRADGLEFVKTLSSPRLTNSQSHRSFSGVRNTPSEAILSISNMSLNESRVIMSACTSEVNTPRKLIHTEPIDHHEADSGILERLRSRRVGGGSQILLNSSRMVMENASMMERLKKPNGLLQKSGSSSKLFSFR